MPKIDYIKLYQQLEHGGVDMDGGCIKRELAS